LTHESAPQKNAGQWRALSLTMRDSAMELANASQKKNAGGILKAAVSLETSCTRCHSAFKSK
jgi:cytochrome c556